MFLSRTAKLCRFVLGIICASERGILTKHHSLHLMGSVCRLVFDEASVSDILARAEREFFYEMEVLTWTMACGDVVAPDALATLLGY